MPGPLHLSRRACAAARTAVVAVAVVAAGLAGASPVAALAQRVAPYPPTAAAAAVAPVTGVAAPGAYWLVASDGGIFTFGGVPFAGSAGGLHLNQPIVAMAATLDGRGYWLVARDGGIFSYGDASFHGSLAGLPPAARPKAPVVAIAPTADAGGYWIATADGGVYAFGDAPFFGSRAGHVLPAPIATMALTADGGGYWLAGADGAVFSFGDAPFLGSANQHRLSARVIGMAGSSDGGGYWMATADGGMYTFGTAGFFGSVAGVKLNSPVVGLALSPDGAGYWMATADGGIFSFGDAPFRGSAGGRKLNSAVVAIAAGHTLDPYPPGSSGFDISFPQCPGGPPAPGGAFAVVGVNDGKAFTHNPCFAALAAWAGPHLSIYMNLNAPPGGDPAGLSGPAGQCVGNDTGCMAYNYGFNAAIDSFTTATAAGASAGMWWLDVETANTWDTNAFNNGRTIEGALDALTQQGAVAGIYSTSFQYGRIAGTFAPATPVWVATGSGFQAALDYCSPLHAFGGGTPWLTQFQIAGVPFDQDYACPVT